MAYRNNRKSLVLAIVIVMSIAAVAVWQFYAFVTFKNGNGMLDTQGGTQHFFWAIGLGLLACVIAFLTFSIFLRYDSKDQTHITSPPSRKKVF